MSMAYARRSAGEYFRFAMVLTVLSLGCAARAGTPEGAATSGNAPAPEKSAADASGTAAPAKRPPKKLTAQKKPTIEELEQRILLLEQKLEAQQQASAAALQSATAAQNAAAAAQTSAAAAQQAAAPAAARAAAPAEQQHPVTVQGA